MIDDINRRTFMKGAAMTALGVSSLPNMSFADSEAAILEACKKADIDWRAFAGEKLTIGALKHPWANAIRSALPVFEKLTGMTVTLKEQSEAEYVAEMPIKLGGKSDDVDVMMIYALGQFISAGWAEPLESYYSDSSLFDAAWFDEGDMFPMGVELPVSTDGSRYSMSITAEAQTLFANQKSLNAAGVDVPKTMDELLMTAKKLKTSTQAGIVMRSKADGTAGGWPCGGFVFSYGGEVINKDGMCVLDSDEAIAGVEMYGRLLREAGPLGVGNYHWYEVLTDFSSGAAAMGIDSSNFATDIADPKKSVVSNDAIYGALPKAGNNPIKPNIWAWQAGINAYSKKKKAAFLLLMFINSKQGCAITSSVGLATARNSAWKSDAFQKRFGSQAATASLANLNAGDAELMKAVWYNPKAGQILDPWGIAINQIATGQKDARSALIAATSKINKAIG